MQYVSFDYLAWVACSYFFVLAVQITRSTVVARNRRLRWVSAC